MKSTFITLCSLLSISISTTAQVTLLNNNSGLEVQFKLPNEKAIFKSPENFLWASDATPAGTIQLSNTVKYERGGGVLNGKLIFPGFTNANGNELWITDGTVAGTVLLKDINPGTASASPDDDYVLLNGYLYFTAETPEAGRELWRTDGTTAGTTIVKDIRPGPAQSALHGKYNLYSSGDYLLLNVVTELGYELWRSDGTADGTQLLKDINPGQSSSDANNFVRFNNIILFTAKDEIHGTELWKTDGTTNGTHLVKDIRDGAISSLNENTFYILEWKGHAYFVANDGVHGEELWSTDGTTANTFLVKDIQPGAMGAFSIISLVSAVKLENKIIFPAYELGLGGEFWESDGTSAGTKLFKEIAEGLDSGIPILLTPYSLANPGKQQLYQGNRFFFIFLLPAEGVTLWISDGTVAGTTKIKTLNADMNAFENLAFAYTSAGLFFSAIDGAVGGELWKSDGTTTGTGIVADINEGAENSDISFVPFLVNNKLTFQGTNGDHEIQTDLFRIDADLIVLPVKLSDFAVTINDKDGLLNWETAQEVNSKNFIVERSYDGVHFSSITNIPAAGFSLNKKLYNYTDHSIDFKNEVVYYRLQLNDRDGKSTASKVIAVKLNGAGVWGIKLNENPVSSAVNIQVYGIEKTVQLQVFDMLGRRVANSKSTSTNGVVSITVQSLPMGVYQLHAVGNGERKTIQFLKQ